jgi:hypothetical protein
MADIYEGAIITIAASCSKNSDHGFPPIYQRASTTSSVGDTGLFVRELGLFPHNLSDRQVPNYIESWPLLTRAWVYQERKLSACVVHIGKEQLYWECRESFRSENGAEDILDPYNAAPTLKHESELPGEAWRKDVADYSQLCLTYEKDRLPAISAVVERMQTARPGDTYVAGLWIGTLLQDLAWEIMGPAQPRPEPGYPSWSWLSIKTGVSYTSTKSIPSARLVNVEYEITGPKHIGRTLHAKIDIMGKTATVTWLPDPQQHQQGIYVLEEPLKGTFKQLLIYQYHSSDFDFSTARPPIVFGETLNLLFLGLADENPRSCVWLALVLRKTGAEWYQRIGSVLFHIIPEIDGTYDMEDFIRRQKLFEEFIDSLPTKQFGII